jgi:hypothetical protein
MKKFVAVMALMLGVCAFSSSAFATVAPSFMNLTDGDGSKNTVLNYNLKQQPWVSISLPSTGFKLETASWTLPGGTTQTSTPIFTSNDDAWFTVSSWGSLTNAQKAGSWAVTGSYATVTFDPAKFAFNQSPTVSSTLRFNVAPEPISATLFLLGGAGLAIRRFRGKKNS